MGAPLTVSVVRSDNRRGAVAEALALISDPIRAALRPRVFVRPHLDRSPQNSTPSASLSALLDVLLSHGACEVLVVGESIQRFEQLGHVAECWGRPVRFLDQSSDVSAELHDPESASDSCWVALTSWNRLARVAGVEHAGLDAEGPEWRIGMPCLQVVEGWSSLVRRRALAIAGTDAVAVERVALALKWPRFGRLDPNGIEIAILGDATMGNPVQGRWRSDLGQPARSRRVAGTSAVDSEISRREGTS